MPEMKFNGQRGMALISVIMLVVIFISLGVAVLYMVFGESVISNDEISFLQALYAAEGGIRKFIAELNSNPDVESWSEEVWAGFRNYKVGEGEIENIFVEDMGDYYEVKVIGKSGRAKKTLVAKISKPEQSSFAGILRGLTVCSSNFSLTGNPNIEGNIFAAGNVSLAGNAVIKGNIYSSRDFSSTGSALVDGDVFAAGSISTSGNSKIMGNRIENAEVAVQVMPEINLDWYRKKAQSMGQYFETDKQFSREEIINLNGIYFVEGNVSFDNSVKNYSGQALIVSSGSIVLTGSQELIPADEESSLGLMSISEISFSGSSNFGGVIIAQGTLKVSGSGMIEGAAAAVEVEDFNKDFLYRPSFVEKLETYLGAEGGAAVIEWRELYPVY